MPAETRCVIITGGGTGIGKEIAKGFASNGDTVIICARGADSLQKTANELASFPGKVVPLACNVADETSVKNLVESTVSRFGRIDVLVNNAGVQGPVGLAFENDSQEWLETVEINLFGVFLMSKYVAPIMIKQCQGSIINLSGGGAASQRPKFSAYAAAKAGVVSFTEDLAQELAEYNIRVNAIAPGFVATRIHDKTIEAGEKAGPEFKIVKEKLESGGEDPRLAAELALFLASKKAEKITGRLISAVWDNWRAMQANGQNLVSNNLYTVRRIDNVFFKEILRK